MSSPTNTTMAITGPLNSQTSAPTGTSSTWRLAANWAHFGDRLDDAMREAVDAPNSRCMLKRAAGQMPGIWDYVQDMADVLERV